MLRLQEIKTIVYDVTDSVFDRCREGFLYITKDNLYSESYIISVPVIHFVYTIKEKSEADYQQLLHDEGRVPDRIIRENLVKVIREAVKEFR